MTNDNYCIYSSDICYCIYDFQGYNMYHEIEGRAEQVFEIVESDVKLREFRTALSDKNKINSSIFYYENIRKFQKIFKLEKFTRNFKHLFLIFLMQWKYENEM